MIASRPMLSTITLAPRTEAAPRNVVEVVVGELLELMIHSVESLRDRLSKIALR